MVKRRVQISECGNLAQLAAAPWRVADHLEAFGGGSVECGKIFFCCQGLIQHGTGSVFVIRRKGSGRSVQRLSHPGDNLGRDFTWLAKWPTRCHGRH
jgi:hypothetical protein